MGIKHQPYWLIEDAMTMGFTSGCGKASVMSECISIEVVRDISQGTLEWIYTSRFVRVILVQGP